MAGNGTNHGAVAVNTDAALQSRIEELSNGAAILVLSGEIDLATAPVMVTEFKTLADRDLTDVIIDAREVSFIDSTGLHGLVEGKRIIHEKGSKIVLVPSPQLRRVLELVFPEPLYATRLDTMNEAFAHLGIQN
jgi:anti-sigma B factor antagonist